MFPRQLEGTDRGSVDKRGNMLVFILVSPFRGKGTGMFHSEPKILIKTTLQYSFVNSFLKRKIAHPAWLMIERQPMSLEVTAQFPVRQG